MKRSLIAALALCACGDTARPFAVANAPVDPSTCPSGVQPTFSSIYENVLKPICTGCHQTSVAAAYGHLDLSLTPPGANYAQLVDVPAHDDAASNPPPGLLRVKPGDPDASLLWIKLTLKSSQDPRYGSGMPQDRPGVLCQQVTDTVRAWIQAGAPQD